MKTCTSILSAHHGAVNDEEILTDTIKIDVQAIPAYVRDELVAPLQAIVTDYFKEPGVEERYQEWLRNRKKNGYSCTNDRLAISSDG